jgi:hypothetical protein
VAENGRQRVGLRRRLSLEHPIAGSHTAAILFKHHAIHQYLQRRKTCARILLMISIAGLNEFGEDGFEKEVIYSRE